MAGGRRAGAAIVALSLCACGGPDGERLAMGGRPAPLEPHRYMLAFGADHTSTLRPPERDLEALEMAARESRGDERRKALRDLAYAHLFAAEEASEDREAARHRREALRHARHATRGSRDAWLDAEMGFIEVWSAWRAGRGGAASVAHRFTRRHPRGGDLVFLAWLVRGEASLEREEWEQAGEAFRFVLGSLEHPLYGYALYRTGQVLEQQGRVEEGRQALREVVQLGCPAGASDAVRRVAALAQHELGMPDVTLEDGRTVPQACTR